MEDLHRGRRGLLDIHWPRVGSHGDRSVREHHRPDISADPAYAEAHQRTGFSTGRKRPLSDHDIVKRVEVVARRQQLLTAPSELRYRAIIDELCLLREVGGAAVMYEQIRHLLQAAERPGTEILLLPLTAGGHPGQLGAFTVLSLPQEQISDVVYIDSLAGQIFLETDEELDRYRKIFEALRAISFDQSKTLEALRNKMAGYETPSTESHSPSEKI